MKTLNWNKLSELGLHERINREILHPLGLAITRNPETGHSEGALIADDGIWEYAPTLKTTILPNDEVKKQIEKLKENPMKPLPLTLKKQWFDMIASGQKTEEYREIKPYWTTRLKDPARYQTVQFKNGYSKHAPTVTLELLGITKGIGKPQWGAPHTRVYILQLGKILTKK